MSPGLSNRFSIKLPRNLDFLLIVRGLAAISVVYWHLGGYLEIENYWSSFFIIPGRLAVWIFFMMSGYLIGHGLIYGRYSRTISGMGRFYINRLLRIYPIFLFVSLVAILIAYSDLNIDLGFIARELLMVQWDHSYELNGVFWTLGVEVHFYLMAPLLVFGSQLIFKQWVNWSVALYLLVLLAVWLFSKSGFFVSWDMRSVLGGITHFVIGIVCASYKYQIIALTKKPNTLLILSILVLLLISYFNHGYNINFRMTLVSNLIGVGLIFLHIMLEAKEIGLNLLVKILLALGVLSYGIYAWHGLLIINGYFMDSLPLHLAATIFLAYLTYLMVERPLLKLKQ